LKSTLDRYLTAVAKHDPAAAPLGAAFRQTENAVAAPLPMQGAANWSALRTPCQAEGGSGARQRLSPTGGAANGRPR
jgi:hypothetical protein